jgi:hypothetical protein
MNSYNPFREDQAEISRENELVAQARGGNRRALEELIRLHQPCLFNIILRSIFCINSRIGGAAQFYVMRRKISGNKNLISLRWRNVMQRDC